MAENRKDLARRLLLEKAILDALQDANAKARAAISQEYEPGDADTVRLDEQPVGKVSMSKGATTARVVDRVAFTGWMVANRPEDVEEVHDFRVRPATEKALLAQAKSDGGLFDRTTGEEIPGVQVTTGAPQLKVALEDFGRQLGAALAMHASEYAVQQAKDPEDWFMHVVQQLEARADG